MAKKRKCRMTAEEISVHEEAVRLRKMTDRQLVDAFRAAQTAVDDEAGEESTSAVETLLNELAEGKCKGVKGATAYKVAEYARDRGLV